jgi:hypothetical protein
MLVSDRGSSNAAMITYIVYNYTVGTLATVLQSHYRYSAYSKRKTMNLFL